MDYPNLALRRRHHVLVLLWALLFAKCFVLEYCVAAYQVPVNSVIYVWSLSLFMATVASIVYVNLTREEQGGFKIHSSSGRVWVICLTVTLLIVIASFAFGLLPLTRLPALAALIFAIGYGVQYFYRREPAALCCAAGWCLCAGLLLQMAHPYSLLVFGICLVAFAAFPSFLVYLKLRQQAIA